MTTSKYSLIGVCTLSFVVLVFWKHEHKPLLFGSKDGQRGQFFCPISDDCSRTRPFSLLPFCALSRCCISSLCPVLSLTFDPQGHCSRSSKWKCKMAASLFFNAFSYVYESCPKGMKTKWIILYHKYTLSWMYSWAVCQAFANITIINHAKFYTLALNPYL